MTEAGVTAKAVACCALAAVGAIGGVTAAAARIIPVSVADDLSPVGNIVGDATVVALGEGVHCASEPLEFRNRLFQDLVRAKGFTAIAIESGAVEGRTVYDYVRGHGDSGSDVAGLRAILEQGIGWTFDQLPENGELIRWMRIYNSDRRHRRKISFYGFDIPGSPGNALAHRGIDTALTAALAYLARVDDPAAIAFRERLHSLLPHLRFDARNPGAEGYGRLTRFERDTLTAVISELRSLLERRKLRYEAASTIEDYTWGYRAAVGAQQADDWLRQMALPSPNSVAADTPPAQLPDHGVPSSSTASDVRDRAQADNIEWIIRHEGSRGKVLVFAHNGHLSGTPLEARWFAPEGTSQIPAGSYLRARLKRRWFSIGNVIWQGMTQCAYGPPRAIEPPAADSLEAFVRRLGNPPFVLDMRRAPRDIADRLDAVQPLGRLDGDGFEASPGRAFDALLYIDRVTPALREPALASDRMPADAVTASVASPPADAITASAAPSPAEVSIPNTRHIEFVSKLNGHRYAIDVALPFQPAPPAGFPVLYVLDGKKLFASATEMVRGHGNVRRGVIVVGIGYPRDPYFTRNVLANRGPVSPTDQALPATEISPELERTYDLTLPATDAVLAAEGLKGYPHPRQKNVGGLDDFLEIIELEIKPRVAALARTDSAHQALFGHSFGGLAVLHALFVEPTAFHDFIIASPSIWWNNRAVLAEEPAFSSAVATGRVAAHVLISAGQKEGDLPISLPPGLDRATLAAYYRKTRMIDNASELAARLKALHGGAGYRVEDFVLFPGVNHSMSAWPALVHGVALAFSDLD